MRLETAGEITAAIPILFTLLLVFLFLFLFLTRNLSFKQTFTPVAIFLFSVYTAIVIGLWGFFLTQKKKPHPVISNPPAKNEFEGIPADFSDEIILHNDTLPIPGKYSHSPREATPIPDFKYRQNIVPRTIAERLQHFQQHLQFNRKRYNMLQAESQKTELKQSQKGNIQKELFFLQEKHDHFLAPVTRNLTRARQQLILRNKARTKQYNKTLTSYLKQRIEAFLESHKTLTYTQEDSKIVNGFIQEILNTRIDPNMTVTDRAFPIYSGPLLKVAMENRFPMTSEFITALLQKQADVNINLSALKFSDLPKFLQYALPNGLENVDTFRGKNILLTLAKDSKISPRDLLYLLLFGADVLPVDENGRTALHHIAMRGDSLYLFQILMYAGAEINAMDRDGFTPLMLTYFSTNPDAVREMEFFAPNPDIINRFGAKASDYATQRKLILSVIHNHPSEVQNALDAGADPYQVLSEKLNIFQLACLHESLESVEVLLKNGINPNILPEDETPQGRLPLHIALKKNNIRLFQLLLSRNANYKTPVLCIHKKPHPLIHAICETPAGKPFLQSLLEVGADINSRSRNQETPLMKAVSLPQNEEVIRCLLEHGADVNAQDMEGETALMRAVFHERKNHIRLLLEAGADPDIQTNAGRAAKDYTSLQEIRDLLTSTFTPHP